jgi:putative transposase
VCESTGSLLLVEHSTATRTKQSGRTSDAAMAIEARRIRLGVCGAAVHSDGAFHVFSRPHLGYLAQDFAIRADRGLNSVWVSDITEIPTEEGALYLATVLALASRRVIGWAMDDDHGVDLPLSALAMALEHRTPVAGAFHHSDRGSEYTSAPYQTALAAHGLTPSMSGTGNCYDNAVAESFFATLEQELLLDTRFPTRFAARRAIIHFIEIWYNRQRRHSSVGMISPVRYENQRAA